MKTNASVLVIQLSNPAAYPPMVNAIRCLSKDYGRVDVLGAACGGPRNLKVPNDISKHVTVLPPFLAKNPKIMALSLFLSASVMMIWKRYTLLYVSDPNACVVAVILYKLFKVPMVYHEHDFPYAKSELLADSRAFVLKYSEFIIAPNRNRFKKGRQRDRILQVMNVPSIVTIRQFKKQPVEANKTTIYFHGSLNPIRLPMLLLESLSTTKNTELVVVGYETEGSKCYMDDFSAYADKKNVNLSYLGPLNYEQCIQSATKAHVGICFYGASSDDINMIHMAGASNKPFDYLAAGLAILVEDHPEWRAMFDDVNLPVAFVDSTNGESIVRGIQKCQSFGNENHKAAHRRLVNEWNYEFQFSEVIARLSNIQNGRKLLFS